MSSELEEIVKRVNLCTHPVVAHKMTQLRRSETSSKHFRELMHEITEFLGYKATEDLPTKDLVVQTPIAQFKGAELDASVGLIPVMRSGLGMLNAMLDILPTAPVFHLGIYRDKKSLSPVVYYNKLPAECNIKRAIVLEPLIATAGTINAVVEMLSDWGVAEIVVIAVIASVPGLQQLFSEHPKVTVYVAEIDEKLTEEGYIFPGLGDSGERINNITVPVQESNKRQKTG